MIPGRTKANQFDRIGQAKANQFDQIGQAMEANFGNNSWTCSTHDPSNNKSEEIISMINIFDKSEEKKRW